MKNAKNKVMDFTVGADPEFACLTSTGNVVCASDYISNSCRVEFGSDGNGTTFELRPGPSKNPLEIVNNIHRIFARHVLEMPEFLKFKWIAGSWYGGYTFGGHVHFGIKENLISYSVAASHLDHYVGAISLLLEDKTQGLNRRKNGYGRMGDVRTQKWGFEYRPMSSWLSSPYAAAAILCLAKTVMYEVLNNKKFSWNHYVASDDFHQMNQVKLFKVFPKMWEDVTQMELYQVYKPYIDLIYFLVMNKKTWLPSGDMKECWGIVDVKSHTADNKIDIKNLWNKYNSSN